MAVLVSRPPPCVLFEDEHLLLVNKPPGWNTHSPAPFAGEGIHEWLKCREPRWARLAIVHRLDKETSGLLLFSKTAEANRSLTDQFAAGNVRKEYILRTRGRLPADPFVVRSHLKRVGDKYASLRGGVSGVDAETSFEMDSENDGVATVRARPRTGRTHQIRVHASENGFPILGDALYGGPASSRLWLHSCSLALTHPTTGEALLFRDQNLAATFYAEPWISRRTAMVGPETDAFRWIHGKADGWPNFSADQFGPYVLTQSGGAEPPTDWRTTPAAGSGWYHKTTTPHVRGKSVETASPKHQDGAAADGPFTILENGVRYEINFSEGYSVGIFLDQRDNRLRLATGHIGPEFSISLHGAEVLNTFAYTCAFSVCAALAGAKVTSLDLSRKYLEWGARNFRLNNLDPGGHDFIFGDVFDWMKRLAKKGRQFDAILLDPPTFSQSKETGLFRAEKDYGNLVRGALRLLRPGGVLFASSNAAKWAPEDFLREVHSAIHAGGRSIRREQYYPQPPDFPISRAEPAYLKSAWFTVA